jgi:hypothetical protein
MSATQMTIKQLNSKVDTFLASQQAKTKDLEEQLKTLNTNLEDVISRFEKFDNDVSKDISTLFQQSGTKTISDFSVGKMWTSVKPVVWFGLKAVFVLLLLYGVYCLGQWRNTPTTSTQPAADVKNSLSVLPPLSKADKQTVIRSLDKSIDAIEKNDDIPGSVPSEYLTYYITGAGEKVVDFVQKYVDAAENAKPPLVAENTEDDVKKNYQTLRTYLTR